MAEEVATTTYSLHQQKVLALLPLVSGFPSIAGSVMVLIIIVRDWRQKLRRVYHRLLFMYSILNSVVTLNLMLGFLMLPEGTFWGARGSNTTCNVQASLFSYIFSHIVYITFIAAYYCMVLRFKVNEGFIAKYIEPFSHFLALVYPMIFNIGALRRSFFGPLFGNAGFCWFREDPYGCSNNADIPCELGEGAEAYENKVFMIPIYIIGPSIVASMIIIYVHVRSIVRQNSETMSDYVKAKLRDTRQQCYFYVIAYVGMSFWPLLLENAVSFGVTPDNESGIRTLYPIVIMAKLALPSGGIWNVLIYIRPRVESLKRQYPTETTWNLYRCVIWGVEPTNLVEELPSNPPQQQLFVRGAQTGEETLRFRSTVWGNGADGLSSTPENMLSPRPEIFDTNTAVDDFTPEIAYSEYVSSKHRSTELEEDEDIQRQSRAETEQRVTSGGQQSLVAAVDDFIPEIVYNEYVSKTSTRNSTKAELEEVEETQKNSGKAET